MSSSSSSSGAVSPAGRFIYDVFLSFRGSDTRHGFVSHLYDALKQKGISTFKDDQKLERGKLISPEILRVIQHSRFSIVVFSKDYASSPWCLEELECIIRCTEQEEEETRAVLPVFYGIDPSDVSKVKNSYAESFARHYNDNPENAEMIESWRDALNKAAEFSGWDSRHRDEPSLIGEIVADVLNKLGRENSKKPLGHLVGMEPRIKEVELLLRTGLADVRMVGIWGMPGIGKTTTAEAVYHHVSHKFDACCFLKSVREVSERHGLDYLRNKLLSALIVEDGLRILDEQLDALIRGRLRSKRVLIVLDDVSSLDQLMSLAGEREWFGPGSRIIITTKDKHLLEQHEVDSVYEVKLLSCEEATELLHQRAFKKKPPTQDFEEVFERVVNYAQGFPLAIEVLGLSLFNMNKEEWESKLNTLEEEPPGDIVKILGLSLDMLERSERNMFLDVVCFLNGESTDYVVSILEGCGFSPHYGLKVLVNRSLLTIQDDKVSMPDLLQHLGREIVRRESFSDAGRRSRLWKHEDVCNVLTQNSGTSNVEVIILDISKLNNEMSLEVEAFHKMTRLRLLKIFWPHQSGASEYDTEKDSCETVPRVCPVGRKLHLLGNLRMLSNELRSLHWHGYPFESLPSYFNPGYIVELNLSHSSLKILWTGKKVSKKLKVMKLSYSHELTQTPDFSGILNLEILVLEGCVKLTEVHPSIGSLEKLVYLNFNGCSNLCQLPVQLASLVNLEEIHADGTSLELNCFMSTQNYHVPLRKKLKKLTLRGSSAVRKSWSIVGSHFMTLSFNRMCPFSFDEVCYLESLDLSYCNLMHFHHYIGHLVWLTELDLSGNGFSDFPYNFEFPMRLEVLTLTNCKNLVRIPSLPAARHRVVAHNCPSLRLIDSPRSITKEGKRDFDLMNCSSLESGGWVDLARNVYRVVRNGPSSSSTGVDLEFLEWLGVVDSYEKEDAPFGLDQWYRLQPPREIFTNYMAARLLMAHVDRTPGHTAVELSVIVPGDKISVQLPGIEIPHPSIIDSYNPIQGPNYTSTTDSENRWSENPWLGYTSPITTYLERLSGWNQTASVDLLQSRTRASHGSYLRGLAVWVDLRVRGCYYSYPLYSSRNGNGPYSDSDPLSCPGYNVHPLSFRFKLTASNGLDVDSGRVSFTTRTRTGIIDSENAISSALTHTWLRFVPAAKLVEVIDWERQVVHAEFQTNNIRLEAFRCGLIPIWRPLHFARPGEERWAKSPER